MIDKDKNLLEVLDKIEQIRNYLDAVEKEALTRAMEGEKLPGFKLGRGNSHRKWVEGSEHEVIKTLEKKYNKSDYLKPEELLSPSKIENLDKKNLKVLVAHYSYKPEGNIKIVSNNDKRKEIFIK